MAGFHFIIFMNKLESLRDMSCGKTISYEKFGGFVIILIDDTLPKTLSEHS